MDMASTSSASTELNEVVQIKTECTNTESEDVSRAEDTDNLTDLLCPICSEYFHEPKILDCLHNVCRPCLEKVVLNRENEFKTIVCPVCDVKTRALNSFIGLTNNTTLRGLVEEKILKDKISGDVSKISCQACVDGNTAVSRCMDCDDFLCSECQNAHQRLVAMKSHDIVPIADLTSGKIPFKSKLRDVSPKCTKHRDQNLCFFCMTCEMQICTTCTVLDHCRPDHSYSDIETAIDSCRSEVWDFMTQAERSKDSFQDGETLTLRAESRLKQLTNKAQKEVSAKADREVAKIKNKERQLKMEIQGAYNQRVVALGKVKSNNSKKVSMAKQNLKRIGKMMLQASHSEILSLKPKIINNLKDLISTKCDSVPYSLSYVHFKESKFSMNKNLGKFLDTEKWELKSQLGEGGENNTRFDDLLHVAAFPHGNLLIFDRGHNKIMVFSPAGEQIQALPDEIGPVNFSSAIAVVSEDRFVFTSNSAEKKVKIIGPENDVLHDVTPWTDSKELASLTKVEENMIAVGDKGMDRIGLLDETGSLLKTIPAKHIGQYLTFNRATKHLIYTDYEAGRLIAIDLNSNCVFSVETLDSSGNQVFPTGVCCDNQGEIYVAVQKSKRNTGGDEIYHYTPEGIFAKREIKGMLDVYGITFTNDGSLAVADSCSLKIFHITKQLEGHDTPGN